MASELYLMEVGDGRYSNLMPMDYEQYDQWSENARLAREEYVQGKLTAEEFLRKIDATHELPSYEAGKIDLPNGPSRWQQIIARDFRFDPERHFPEEKAHLDLSYPDADSGCPRRAVEDTDCR